MLHNKYIIWQENEYHYPGAFGFVPNLYSYIHEDEVKRPCMLVIPGGGYGSVVPSEGGIVAKRFFEAGYQAFVLTYTTDLLHIAPLKMQPLNDISRAVRYIRANAERFQVDEDCLFVIGFSAGAHLAGSLAVHWQDVEDRNLDYKEVSNKPQGVILSYPVITTGEYAHKGSVVTLLGENASEEELAYFSLEKQVSDQTPPVFLWQTVTDEEVPVKNSMLMAEALQEKGVPFEYHLFPKGAHGLSLSNEDWEKGNWGELYTMEQMAKVAEAIKKDRIPLPEEVKAQLLAGFGDLDPSAKMESAPPELTIGVAIKEVAVWPELALAWLASLKN